MIRAKIGVLSPYPEFAEHVLQLAEKWRLEVEVREGIPGEAEDAEDIVRQWEAEGRVGAVVALGATAAHLRKVSAIPVVMAEVSNYELVNALCRAGTMGDRVVLLDYQWEGLDYKRIAEIVNFPYQTILFRSYGQLTGLMGQVRRGNYDVVVSSDAAAAGRAKAYGLRPVMVKCEQGNIQDALKKASEIAGAGHPGNFAVRSLETIIDSANDGIMAVNEKGEVTTFNPAAEKTTGLRLTEVRGMNIKELCRTSAVIKALYGDGGALGSQFLNIGDLPVVISRVPVKAGNKEAGLVVVFQAAGKIRKCDAKKIRQELPNHGLVAKFRFSDIIGKSAMIQEAIRECRKYARSEAAVLITGESGTGKELFAQSLHNESSRRDGPFVAVNCAALPENLLESELFGYEEGAFTGARRGGKQGLFTLAHGGTIFLDEIGDLSLGLQARLLRVLQEKEVMPVGGQRLIPVDVRVISATNRNIGALVDEGKFRADLYYRLNVLNLQIPPLRARLEDVPSLFRYFYERLAGPERLEALNITENLLELLKKYMWPGNIRELEGFVERYVALGEENIETHATFHGLFNKLIGYETAVKKPNSDHIVIELGNMVDMERQILAQVSGMIPGGKGEMARVLGVSRTTLWKKLKELDIHVPGKQQTG
ncbi:MAG: sigma 54-interacting transcriptional regulator [Bacillota bacterium]